MANPASLIPFANGPDSRRNMKGGGQSISGILNKLLSGKITIEDAEAKLHKVTKKEAMCINMVADALDTDEDPTVRHRATMWIVERMEGKSVAPIELSGPEGGVIRYETLPLEKRLQLLELMEQAGEHHTDEPSAETS